MLPMREQFSAGERNRRGGIFPPPEILSPILMRSDLRPLKLRDSSESGKWVGARWPHARSQEWEWSLVSESSPFGPFPPNPSSKAKRQERLRTHTDLAGGKPRPVSPGNVGGLLPCAQLHCRI